MAATKTKSKPAFTAEDPAHWAALGRFREALDGARRHFPDHRSFGDPKRRLALGDYLVLFLLGLFSPVARTLRGLVQASPRKIPPKTGLSPPRPLQPAKPILTIPRAEHSWLEACPNSPGRLFDWTAEDGCLPSFSTPS